MDPVTASIIGGLIAGSGQMLGGLLGGSAQGSDDLKKLTKQQLQPDPLAETLKKLFTSLVAYEVMDRLNKAAEDKLLRREALKIAGFNPDRLLPSIPTLSPPTTFTTREKGPSHFVHAPAGLFSSPDRFAEILSGMTPETRAAMEPVIAALETSRTMQMPLPSKGGSALDLELIRGLERGTIPPTTALDRGASSIGAAVTFQTKGKDPTFVLRGEGLPERVYVPRGTPGYSDILDAIRRNENERAIELLRIAGLL